MRACLFGRANLTPPFALFSLTFAGLQHHETAEFTRDLDGGSIYEKNKKFTIQNSKGQKKRRNKISALTSIVWRQKANIAIYAFYIGKFRS